MLRKLLWLPLLLLLALVVWRMEEKKIWRDGFQGTDETVADDGAGQAKGGVEASGEEVPVAIDPDVRQVFRFRIDGGEVTLEQVDVLRGKFKTRRGEPDRWTGMFCYRLLDAENRLLAEETQPAPDHRCVVVDPNVKDGEGKPKAVAMTADGPVIFQVRMPKDPRAAILKVYRLTEPGVATGNKEPAGDLLVSVTVPQ